MYEELWCRAMSIGEREFIIRCTVKSLQAGAGFGYLSLILIVLQHTKLDFQHPCVRRLQIILHLDVDLERNCPLREGAFLTATDNLTPRS